jgi:uncharacterized coiled-coil protein SlyX
MPSAQGVNERGVDLGDVVRSQTKKIEELTLYLLQQADRTESLVDQVKKLQVKINDLQARHNIKKSK